MISFLLQRFTIERVSSEEGSYIYERSVDVPYLKMGMKLHWLSVGGLIGQYIQYRLR